MRILMLGWEFPPHISGGLGTACFGLTQGLREHGMAIDFVVPRVFGDEDQRYVDLLSCEQTLRTQAQRQPASGQNNDLHDLADPLVTAAGLPDPLTGVPSRWRIDDDHRGMITVGVDSLLHPYLNPTSYDQRYTALARAKQPNSSAPADSVGDEWDPAGHANASQWSPNAFGDQSSEHLANSGPFFSGRYGRDLFLEVHRYAQAVESIAATRDFAMIHAHDWMTYPAAIRAKATTGKPLVLHLHASEYDRSGEHPNTLIRDLEGYGFAHADRIICVSHYTAALLKRHYGVPASRLRVVHNAVNQEPRLHTRDAKAIAEPIVLFLGRVTFQKGPDYFVEAARKVLAVEKNVKFVMAGDGDLLKPMIERAASYGIARNLHFTGFLRGADVERMYAMADIYIMPSVSEPFGIAPLEAMSLDVPVIVSKQSGVAEILRNALKVDFWDTDELANKIISLLRQPALRESLVRGGREELRHMQWNHRAEKVISVYRELMS